MITTITKTGLILILLASIGFLVWRINWLKSNQISNQPVQTFNSTELGQNSNPNNQAAEENLIQPELKEAIYYPMTDFFSRILIRDFGQNVQVSDRQSLECGQTYVGFHTAVDLEAKQSELNSKAPVFSVAQGVVKQVRVAKGYGGLMVIEHNIDQSTMMGIYGHLDLSTVSKQVNDPVEPGEKIANLGDQCSNETGNERKHLHFGLVLGNNNETRGYVDNQNELRKWQNPKTFLKDLQAKEPMVK